MILCMHPRQGRRVALPANGPAPRRTLSGDVFLRPPLRLLHGTVIVRLLDTTLADMAAETVGEQEFRVLGIRIARLPFRLEVPSVAGRGRFQLSAEVRRGRGPSISPGDYINTSAVPWSPDSAEGLAIHVTRIH